MTTYHVDLVNGSDGQAGSAAAPWKDPRYAIRMLGAGDLLVLNGSTKTAPYRMRQTVATGRDYYKLDFADAYTVMGDGMQHFMLSTNLTHGEPAPDLFEPCGSMDRWLAADEMWQCSLSTDKPTKETTITQGSASMKIMRQAQGGSNWSFSEQFSADFEGFFEFRITYLSGDATAATTWRLRDITNDLEFQHDGEGGGVWIGPSGADQNNLLANNYPGHAVTADDFTTLTVVGPMPNVGQGVRFDLLMGSTSAYHPTYIDAMSFVPSVDGSGNNVWTYGGNTGFGNYYDIPALEPTEVWWCTKEAWEADGVDALEFLGEPNLTAGHGGHVLGTVVIPAVAEAWAWTSGVLRANLGDLTIDDVHIEIITHKDQVFVLNSADCTLANMHFSCHQTQIDWKQTCHQYNMMFSRGWATVQYTDANATNASVVEGLEVYQSFKDGCVVSGASSTDTNITINGAHLHDNMDEGIQAIFGGLFTINGFVSERNGSAVHGGGAGLAAEGTGSAFTAYNGTVTRNWTSGIVAGSDTDASDSTVENVISYDNGVGGTGYDVNEFASTNHMTITTTHYGTEISTALEDGVDGNVLLTESPFASDGLELSATAAARGAGVRWWTAGPNPIGYDGEPYPTYDLDIGGVQTSRGPFHPVNL